MRQSYLVTYDISDPKRLARVARVCEDHGDRIQNSVFECRLTPSDVIRLRARLERTIDRAEDQVLIVRMGDGTERLESLGRAYEPLDRVAIIV